MVQVAINPVFDVFELPKIDDKAVRVQLLAGKGQCDGPIMPVDIGTVPRMSMLPVCHRDILVRLCTGKHRAMRCASCLL